MQGEAKKLCQNRAAGFAGRSSPALPSVRAGLLRALFGCGSDGRGSPLALAAGREGA